MDEMKLEELENRIESLEKNLHILNEHSILLLDQIEKLKKLYDIIEKDLYPNFKIIKNNEQ